MAFRVTLASRDTGNSTNDGFSLVHPVQSCTCTSCGIPSSTFSVSPNISAVCRHSCLRGTIRVWGYNMLQQRRVFMQRVWSVDVSLANSEEDGANVSRVHAQAVVNLGALEGAVSIYIQLITISRSLIRTPRTVHLSQKRTDVKNRSGLATYNRWPTPHAFHQHAT